MFEYILNILYLKYYILYNLLLTDEMGIMERIYNSLMGKPPLRFNLITVL